MSKTTTADQYTDLHLAADRAEQTAKRWTQLSTRYPNGKAAQLLASVLEDPNGLNFTVEFVDGVVRPEDIRVAANNLHQLTKTAPTFLPTWLRIPAQVGGAVGYLAPEIVIPAARKVFSQLVGDLVVDVTDHKLGPVIEKLRADGSRLNINLLGEAVLGDAEADRRLAANAELLKRDDIDYVSLKVSAVTGPSSHWDTDAIVESAVEKLLPLYEFAAQSSKPKFINLDMEEYKDLDITIQVFETLLDRPELKNLEAGIVIQAYLPDALDAYQGLVEWAQKRVADGGAPIKIRLVKGANLAMERVEAEIHDWPLALWESKQASDANYLRILDWALTPERTAAARIGVAGHNLFSLAFAWDLAEMRGVRDGIDIEMLAGMAEAQAQAVRDEVGNLLLYVPVVHPREFDVAIAYLVRRLEENSTPENFMSNVFDIGEEPRVFELERDRFRKAVTQVAAEGTKRCAPSRTQNRQTETEDMITASMRGPGGDWQFKNTANTDPALIANREWAKQIMDRVPTSTVGEDTVAANTVDDIAELDERMNRALEAQKKWAEKSPEERSDLLHRVGVQMELRRAELLEAAAAELGKGIGQADPEVSEAIDFAHYYAQQLLELDRLPGAKFVPAPLTVVTPPWNFPLAIPLGGTLSALAAGGAVMLKPSSAAKRCGALLAECIWAAGVDPDLAQLVVPGNREVGKELVVDERVERVVLTGSSDTAEMFLGWRPDLTLLAETSGKNSIIVTPSADLDLAAKDVVNSAFGHAGQKCSAASLVILVGSVGKSERFRNQLLDAVRSLHVAWPTDLSEEMGPLSELPGEKLMRGLTKLEPGQTWAIKPYKLDDTDRLWSPGVRAGVEPGSEFQQVEYFGPILGVIRVDTLEEAIEVQNSTVFGLTAGLQSLSVDEVNYWLDRVQAGNVYVNRGITGAIVQRQPFGGWKLSAVGPGAKAGGPNYLFGLGSFEESEQQKGDVGGEGYPEVPERELHLEKPQLNEAVSLARDILGPEDAERVERAAYNLEHACVTHFDQLNDPTDLKYEKNVLRYLPARSVLRAEKGVELADILTAAMAAVAVGDYRPSADDPDFLVRFAAGQTDEEPFGYQGAQLVLSTTEALPDRVQDWAHKYGFACLVESPDEFSGRLNAADVQHDGRVRLLGAPRAELMRRLDSPIDFAVWDGPATTAGRVEIIPFVHEQAVSVTTHRYGTPSAMGVGVL